jgi:acyl-CoA thioesterase
VVGGRRSANTRGGQERRDRRFFEKAAAELGHDAILAPLTFISVFGYQAQLGMFQPTNIAITDAKIVQVDQALKFLRPIKAGDTLYCDVYVHSIRQSFGATSS